MLWITNTAINKMRPAAAELAHEFSTSWTVEGMTYKSIIDNASAALWLETH